MIPKTMKPFMYRLLEATNDQEVVWKEGADDAYFTTQKDADIHVRQVFDAETGESGYTFRLTRPKADAFFTVVNGEDDYYVMRNLYAAISVNSSGGADAFDDLFD